MSVLRITDMDGLRVLAQSPGQFDRVELDLPGLDPQRADTLARRWTRWASECGCSSGGVVVLAMVAVTVPAALWATTSANIGWIWAAVAVIGSAAVASVIAKLATIRVAHHRLRRDIGRLAQVLHQP